MAKGYCWVSPGGACLGTRGEAMKVGDIISVVHANNFKTTKEWDVYFLGPAAVSGLRDAISRDKGEITTFRIC